MKVFEKIYLGGGCFWCTEAAFKRLNGVTQVISGYSGGSLENPSYKDVCSGKTGHAEVVEVVFDNSEISLKRILEIFFKVHNPTTKDRQGGDIGSQYRSIILYTSPAQKRAAEDFIKNEQEHWKDPIKTEIKAFAKFWPAEDYHRDYFKRNPLQPYCMMVIRPKIKKLDQYMSRKG